MFSLPGTFYKRLLDGDGLIGEFAKIYKTKVSLVSLSSIILYKFMQNLAYLKLKKLNIPKIIEFFGLFTISCGIRGE